MVDEFTTEPNKAFATITATPKALLDRNRELMIVWSKSVPVPLITKSIINKEDPSDEVK